MAAIVRRGLEVGAGSGVEIGVEAFHGGHGLLGSRHEKGTPAGWPVGAGLQLWGLWRRVAS